MLSVRQIILLSRQLYYMVKLSVPLPAALKQLETDAADPEMAAVLKRVCEQTALGKSLALAFSPYTPALFSKLLDFGEKQNRLPEAFQEIAKHYEAQEHLEEKGKLLLFYPGIVITVTFFISWLLFFFVWSNVSFSILQLPLPFWLSAFYHLAYFFHSTSIQISLLGFFLVCIYFFWKKDWFYKTSLFLLSFSPQTKNIYVKVQLLKVSRVLSLLLELNLPLSSCFDSVEEFATVPELIKDLLQAKDLIKKGKSLSDALKDTKWLKLVLSSSLPASAAENPEKLFSLAADSLEININMSSSLLLAVLEPFGIATAGIFVLFATALFWFPFYEMLLHMWYRLGW